MLKLTHKRPCSETKEHFIATNEKETHYWCLICAKELNKDGTEKKC